MPLVKVNLLKGRSAEEMDSMAASIQTALVRTLEAPGTDRYQLFNEYDEESFRHTRYLGMSYTDQLLIVETTFLVGRDDEQKKSLLAEINRKSRGPFRWRAGPGPSVAEPSSEQLTHCVCLVR